HSPEEVIYLLYHGEAGTPEKVAAFAKELQKRSHVSEKTVAHIRLLPKEAHPMQLFVCALMILGTFEGTGDYREDCLNLIAKIPTVVAELINYHAGWQKTRKSDPSTGYMENFTHMLNVPDADEAGLAKVFKLFNVLHYDHGGGNLSTF